MLLCFMLNALFSLAASHNPCELCSSEGSYVQICESLTASSVRGYHSGASQYTQ